MVSFRSVASYSRVSGGTLAILVQLVRVDSQRSNTYSVSGEPPSSLGGFHANVTDVFSTSTVLSGPVGGPGGPADLYIQVHNSVNEHDKGVKEVSTNHREGIEWVLISPWSRKRNQEDTVAKNERKHKQKHRSEDMEHACPVSAAFKTDHFPNL